MRLSYALNVKRKFLFKVAYPLFVATLGCFASFYFVWYFPLFLGASALLTGSVQYSHCKTEERTLKDDFCFPPAQVFNTLALFHVLNIVFGFIGLLVSVFCFVRHVQTGEDSETLHVMAVISFISSLIVFICAVISFRKCRSMHDEVYAAVTTQAEAIQESDLRQQGGASPSEGSRDDRGVGRLPADYSGGVAVEASSPIGSPPVATYSPPHPPPGGHQFPVRDRRYDGSDVDPQLSAARTRLELEEGVTPTGNRLQSGSGSGGAVPLQTPPPLPSQGVGLERGEGNEATSTSSPPFSPMLVRSRIPKDEHYFDIYVEDGNGNVYFLRPVGVFKHDDPKVDVAHLPEDTRILFIYDPISPAESSSGIYSGGDAIHHEGRVSLEGYDTIVLHVQRCAGDASTGEERHKGVTVVHRCPPTKNRSKPLRLPMLLKDGVETDLLKALSALKLL